MKGEVLKRARVRAGLGQKDVADLCDVTQSAVSRWEHGTPIPQDKARIMAERLGIHVSDLVDSAESQEGPRGVRSYQDALYWQRGVMGSSEDMDVKYILVSLVGWIHEGTWVVSVTPKELVDRLEGGSDHIERALNSPWVERFGADYTMRLVFPDQ